MVSVEVVETIARAPADVFAFVADMRNEPRWHTDVLEAQLADGTSVSQGSRFAVKCKPFLGMSDASATVSEYQPPYEGCMRSTWGRCARRRPAPSRTLRVRGRASVGVSTWRAAPLGHRDAVRGGMIRRANVGFIANLKRELEEG
jgi:hypothetical protein